MGGRGERRIPEALAEEPAYHVRDLLGSTPVLDREQPAHLLQREVGVYFLAQRQATECERGVLGDEDVAVGHHLLSVSVWERPGP